MLNVFFFDISKDNILTDFIPKNKPRSFKFRLNRRQWYIPSSSFWLYDENVTKHPIQSTPMHPQNLDWRSATKTKHTHARQENGERAFHAKNWLNAQSRVKTTGASRGIKNPSTIIYLFINSFHTRYIYPTIYLSIHLNSLYLTYLSFNLSVTLNNVSARDNFNLFCIQTTEC